MEHHTINFNPHTCLNTEKKVKLFNLKLLGPILENNSLGNNQPIKFLIERTIQYFPPPQEKSGCMLMLLLLLLKQECHTRKKRWCFSSATICKTRPSFQHQISLV